MNYRIEKGKEGELLVARYLEQRGYTILHYNFRHRLGEVDLIAQKGDTVAFVEVKWRRNPLIDPAEIISPSKQRKIATVAKLFLAYHTDDKVVCRFDVALVEEYQSSVTIRYIDHAFSAFD